MKIAVEDMTLADIPQVVEVDRESYPVPWPASAYRRELNNHSHAMYLVVRQRPDPACSSELPEAAAKRTWRDVLGWPRSAEDQNSRGLILGYAGMWLVADEAHVTTVAVRHETRGQGLGELLMASLIHRSFQMQVRWVTLEVRMSNEVAQKLYRKYGFRDAGVRKRYYSDNNEDALIMTTDDITLNAYAEQFRALTNGLATRFAEDGRYEVEARVFTRALLPTVASPGQV